MKKRRLKPKTGRSDEGLPVVNFDREALRGLSLAQLERQLAEEQIREDTGPQQASEPPRVP